MFKKFISMATAVMMLATGYGSVIAQSASAANAGTVITVTDAPRAPSNGNTTSPSSISIRDNTMIPLFTVGTITWSPTATTFAANTVYTATFTLTATAGNQFPNVNANGFTVSGAGATGVTVSSNAVTAGATTATVTLTFPDTGSGSGGGGGGGGGPSPANSPTIGSITSSSAVVDFSAGVTANPSISSWNIKVTSGNGSCSNALQTIVANSPATTATITGLSGSTTYRVCVQQPITNIGYSPSVTFTTLAGSSSSQTTEQIAAAAAAVAKAAAEAAAAVRAAEIATAQTALSTVLKADKPGTLSEYRSANINITTNAGLTRLNAEVLKLAGADRTDFAKIKALADKIEFDESFFNATARPSLATYSTYGVTGVTERILPTVNAKILELPAALRVDVKAMQDLVKVENFVDRVANTETRSTVSASALIEKGLLSSTSPYKYSVVQGLAKYPEGSLNTMAKIEAAIKEQIAKAEAPKLRLAAIKAKIAARKK
jgi:hypothetical protein